MASSYKPHPPKPMYPMYPEEHKVAKPKHKKEERVCFCCPKRKKHKTDAEEAKEKVEGNKLEFWSVFSVPYLLVTQGLVNSITCPIVAIMFWKECPALPVLNYVLLGRFPIGLIDALGLLMMTAEAFEWSKSYQWASKLTDKVNWRIIAGMVLTLCVVWGTALFNSTNERYTEGKPVSYDPESELYCHPTVYKFAKANQVIIMVYLTSTAFLFIFGGTVLLCSLCTVSRIGS